MADKYLGKRLDGRYVLKEVIGVGGMAIVYKANDITENREVAVKVLKDEYAENEEFVRRFINEARAISVLSHTNIVKVYDASVSQTVKYMVMEYIDGITLKEYISRQGSLRWKDAVFFAVQILRALQHAHDKGIVHRDIKPQNIMLLADGTVKVTDFGIARFSRSSQQTITEKAIGSVHYISPEQARGEATDEKADIYSLGVIMYEMLTGTLPFEAESAVSVAIMQLQSEPKRPTRINKEIPLGVEQITLHAMKKDVMSRYQSAAEMLHDLEDFRRDPEMTFDFDCFVDDSPTRYVDIEEEEFFEDDEPETKEEHSRSVVVPILTGIAAAFMIALIFLGVVVLDDWFELGLFSTKTSAHTVVDFTGHTYESVMKNYGNVFTFETEYESTSDYPAGVVIAQSKASGQKVKKTQTIVLTVSAPLEQTTVPNVIGSTVNEVKNDIDRADLTYEIIYLETDAYEAGTIIACDPQEGSRVSINSVIKLTVAQVPGVENIEVPDVVSANWSSAVKMLESRGFTVNERQYVFSNGYTIDGEKLDFLKLDLPEGYVAGQTPDPKTEPSAPKGTAVTLYISNGWDYHPVEIRHTESLAPGNNVQYVAYINGEVVGTSEAFVTGSGQPVVFNVGVWCEYNKAPVVSTVYVKVKMLDDGTEWDYLVLSVDPLANSYEIVSQN